MVAGAIASQSNLTLAPDPDADITRAIELWEQGNELLLLSGRLFAQAKEQAKRKFTKLLEGASLEKSQVSKLIKGAESADEIPSTVAAKLGLPMLVQLGQPRNQTAREAIAYEDTQLLVAQKIKELRTPTQPKDDAPVRFVGKKEAKLRIEVPAGPTAVELKQDWEVSGLSPLEWLSKRVQRSAPKQELIALVPLVEDAVAVGTQDISEPTIAQSELVVTVNQAEDEFDEIVQQTNSTTLINEVEVGSANECGTIEVQDEVLSNPSTITEVIGGSVTETQGETAPTKNQSCAATATPTDRYKQGWNVGDSAIPNSVGGEYFVNWCGGQPVLIESVSGLAGEIQTLRVARSDGQTDMSFGNWLESVEHTQASTVQALANTTFKIQEVELVETPDLTKLTKALLKAKNWDKVSQLVNRNATILTTATQEWSSESKQMLTNLVVTYLEANPKAILSHELDWMPIESRSALFHQICFKVRDITEGLTAAWHDACEFVDVTNFGKDDDEVWTFHAGDQQIKAWSREDFEVVAFS